MALEFKKFTGNDESTLTELGTVKALAGKKGKIAFIRKNFNDATKRIALVITNAKGESAVVACSSQVSAELRNKRMNIAQLAGLQIVENAEGHNFVSMPATGGLQEFEADKLTAATVEVKAEFLPESLIAF